MIFGLLAAPAITWAGGTPDPGTAPLSADSGDADTLPDNENQLIGVLGPTRGFGFGDYVSDDIAGLQSTIGTDARYRFFIEVPPGEATVTFEGLPRGCTTIYGAPEGADRVRVPVVEGMISEIHLECR